jgi:hypothetical protein
MNIKFTPKQEAFCQAFIQTGNKSAAYCMSYNGSKMKDKRLITKHMYYLFGTILGRG